MQCYWISSWDNGKARITKWYGMHYHCGEVPGEKGWIIDGHA